MGYKKTNLFYIYRFTNLANGKVYIGQTSNLELRYSQYKHSVKVKSTVHIIVRALIKYGMDHFSYENIATCRTIDDADCIEKLLICQYDSRNPSIGYNIAEGGSRPAHSEETRKKMSISISKFYETHDGTWKGKKLTEEHKANVSKGSMGKPGTNLGKKFSKEWCEKISSANIGRKASDETKKRQSESHIGQIPCNRKLTFAQAEEVRKDYKTLLYTQDELSKKYKVSQNVISYILKNLGYKK